MSVFLSFEDLVALTGWKRAKEQIAFLKQQAIPHMVNAAGKPVVLRSVIDKRLGGDTADGISLHVDMDQFERDLWNSINNFKSSKDAAPRARATRACTKPAGARQPNAHISGPL